MSQEEQSENENLTYQQLWYYCIHACSKVRDGDTIKVSAKVNSSLVTLLLEIKLCG